MNTLEIDLNFVPVNRPDVSTPVRVTVEVDDFLLDFIARYGRCRIQARVVNGNGWVE